MHEKEINMPLFFLLAEKDSDKLPVEKMQEAKCDSCRVDFYQQNKVRPYPLYKNISTLLNGHE